MVTPRDVSWYQDEPTPDTGRRRRWVLSLSALVLLAGAAVFVVILHFAPSVGAAGGCGGG